jgi:hypothetical protein
MGSPVNKSFKTALRGITDINFFLF